MKTTRTTAPCQRTFAFAAALPPRAEAMFPTDQWLHAVAAAGYTHLCLQNDPFFHPEMDLRDTGENTFRLLSLFDMTAGPRHGGYRQWLGAVGVQAAKHGLKLAMELWEPRLTRLARQTLPAPWKGPASHNGWVEPLCVSHAPARAWLLRGFQQLLAAASALDTLILGINDNSAYLCGPDCKRCGTRPVVDRLGELYGEIERACRRLRPECRIIPYDWMWDDAHYEAVFSRMDDHPVVLTRLERKAEHVPDPGNPQWRGVVFDESVGCDAVGADFRRSRKIMRRYGGQVVVMPTLSGMFEGFQLPYVPAVGQMAKKFLRMRREGVAGWVDYDCGGIHEGLMLDLVRTVQGHPNLDVSGWRRQLAVTRYNRSVAGKALAIWDRFDRAVCALPFQLDIEGLPTASGRLGTALGLLPWHPFLPERIGHGKDAGRKVFHFDPHLMAVPAALAPVRHCMALARGLVADVPGIFASMIAHTAGEARLRAQRDFAIAELVLLSWRSIANFFDWAAALHGDASINLRRVLADEIKTTQQFRGLALRPELGVGNMTWHPERCVALCVPQAAGDLYHAVECDHLAQWTDPQPCPGLEGNLFAWKIAHLRGQLDQTARVTRVARRVATGPGAR